MEATTPEAIVMETAVTKNPLALWRLLEGMSTDSLYRLAGYADMIAELAKYRIKARDER